MAPPGTTIVLLAALTLFAATGVKSTSMKIDFLRMTNLRTDPITHPNGPSPHVHSFFGVQAAAPSTTYEDLRKAKGNTGNIKENKSLYWSPAIYRFDKKTELYTIEDTSLFSAYYIWNTGKTKAFPDGFKMIGGGFPAKDEAMQFAECVEPGPCPDGDCERWNDFFPATTCKELEMSMIMPSCWDGKRLDSPDHRSHVAYPEGSDPEIDGGGCPDTHPVPLPQIRIFTRIEPYAGGIHMFADGTGLFHADYFSGWEESFLQKVLDECENESFDANPNDWCEDHVTFLDAPKDHSTTIVDKKKLQKFQPKTPFNAAAVSKEKIDRVKALPGGVVPMKDATPRCMDPAQAASKSSCHKLRFADTATPLGGKLASKKACRWKKGRCQEQNVCKVLKSKKNCRKYADEAGCRYKKGRCRKEEF